MKSPLLVDDMTVEFSHSIMGSRVPHCSSACMFTVTVQEENLPPFSQVFLTSTTFPSDCPISNSINLPIILYTFCLPVDQQNSHSMMLPPLCFCVGTFSS